MRKDNLVSWRAYFSMVGSIMYVRMSMCVCVTENVTQTILVLMEYVSSPSLENVVYGKLQIGFTENSHFVVLKKVAFRNGPSLIIG